MFDTISQNYAALKGSADPRRSIADTAPAAAGDMPWYLQDPGNYSATNVHGWRDPREIWDWTKAQSDNSVFRGDSGANDYAGTLGEYNPWSAFDDLAQDRYTQDLADLGWTGGRNFYTGGNTVDGTSGGGDGAMGQSALTPTELSPEFKKWITDNGYTARARDDELQGYTGLFDRNGNLVRQFQSAGAGDDTTALLWAAMAGPMAYSMVAGQGAAAAGLDASAGGGGDVATLGGSGGGFVNPTNAALIDSATGTAGYGYSSAGLGGEVAGGLGASGAAGGGLTAAQQAGLAGSGLSAGQQAYGALENAAANGTLTAGQQATAAGALANGASPAWLTALQNGDIAGALSSGGSAALSYLTSGSGLNLLGGLANGLISSNANSDAIKAQTEEANRALALQGRIYDTTRADLAPYRATGTVGTTGMTNLLANPASITNDPSYSFGLNQGQRAIDNSAASRGGLYSGATLRALDRYGQDYGGTKLNEAYGRYSDAARLGSNAASMTAQAGSTYANGASNTITGLGNAQGASSLYGASNLGGIINNALASLNASAYRQQP